MNIAEILRKCPKGTKLYSLVDGEVTLENVSNTGQYRIEVSVNDFTSTFSQKMVSFLIIVLMENVCFSHPRHNAIGASLKCLTKKLKLNSSHLIRCLYEIMTNVIGFATYSVTWIVTMNMSAFT